MVGQIAPADRVTQNGHWEKGRLGWPVCYGREPTRREQRARSKPQASVKGDKGGDCGVPGGCGFRGG